MSFETPTYHYSEDANFAACSEHGSGRGLARGGVVSGHVLSGRKYRRNYNLGRREDRRVQRFERMTLPPARNFAPFVTLLPRGLSHTQFLERMSNISALGRAIVYRLPAFASAWRRRALARSLIFVVAYSRWIIPCEALHVGRWIVYFRPNLLCFFLIKKPINGPQNPRGQPYKLACFIYMQGFTHLECFSIYNYTSPSPFQCSFLSLASVFIPPFYQSLFPPFPHS